MRQKQGVNGGFTLSELLVVIAMLAVLAAILLTALGPARKMARVAACTSNLRQIGMAYKLYLADYGGYPSPHQFTGSPYVANRRILFCPEDHDLAVTGAASSYRFRLQVPPNFTLITAAPELDPNIVLAGCAHHTGQQLTALHGDHRPIPPAYAFHLVLRAGGDVERVPLSRVRRFFQGSGRPVLQTLYPGEPGYAQARS